MEAIKQRKTAKTITILLLMLIIAATIITPITALAYERSDIDYDWNNPCCDGGDCCIKNVCSCPMCYGRGEPGDECPECGSDLCPDCGNCPDCGTSPCPTCRTGDEPTNCQICNGPLCNACNGCLECGAGRDPDCPYCGRLWRKPLFTIGNTDVYLFAPADEPSWSIINLLAVIGSIAVLTLTTIKAILQKKREEKEDMHSFTLQAIDSADNDSLINAVASKERLNNKRRLWMLAAAFITTVSNIIIFIATQDFKGITALFDSWSIVHAVLLAGSVTMSIFSFRRYEE